MLRQIQLENFKCFGTRVKIPCAPITLIFGQNSAGKSAILQVLKVLKQTRDFAPDNVPILPRTRNGYVDLGSFSEMVSDHDEKRSMVIRLEYDPGEASLEALARRFLDGSQDEDPAEIFERAAKCKLCGYEFVLSHGREAHGPICTRAEIYCNNMDSPVAVFSDPSKEKEWTLWTLRCHQLRENIAEARDFFSSRREMVLKGLETMINFDVAWSLRTLIEEYICMWEATKAPPATCPEHARAGMPDEGLDSLARADKAAWERAESEGRVEPVRNEVRARYQGLIDLFSRDFTPEEFAMPAVSEFDLHMTLRNFMPDDLHASLPDADRALLVGEADTNSSITSSTVQASARNRGQPLHDFDMRVFGEDLRRLVDSIYPLSPLRAPPERWYLVSESGETGVGYSGEWLPNVLLRDRAVLHEINGWMQAFEIDYEFQIQEVGPAMPGVYSLRLLDTRRRDPVPVSVADVGFGVSQILPIMVQSLSSSGSIIVVEQPEIHVHPKLQAELGDLLAYTISAPRNNQFIIETHSEHLMLRIQKLIRRGKLKPEDVSVLYVTRGEEGSRVEQLRLNEKGVFIDEWPDGFFEEDFEEFFDGATALDRLDERRESDDTTSEPPVEGPGGKG